jgi:hypothetical protein
MSESHIKRGFERQVDAQNTDTREVTPRQVSPARRKLLKAAASAAPVIATLPSGEALAMTSSLQCVIHEQDNSNKPQPNPVVVNADQYVRVPGRREVWQSNTSVAAGGAGVGQIEVYRIPDQDGNEILVVGDNLNTNVNPIAPVGTWFNPATAQPPSPSSSAERQFLRFYRADAFPIASSTNVAADPAPPYLSTGCGTSNPAGGWSQPPAPRAGPDGSIGRDCVYPLAVQADTRTPGNIPLTYSCMASFPNAGP